MARHDAYKDRSWSVQPAAENFLQDILQERLGRCPEAERFRVQLLDRTGVRLRDILDHLTFDDDVTAARLKEAGWVGEGDIFRHPGGYFPEFVRRSGIETTYFRVESLDVFAHACPLVGSIEGAAHAPARRAIAFASDAGAFGPFERAGYDGFEIPSVEPGQMRSARIHLQALMARRRQFDTVEQGLTYTEALVDTVVADLGPHWACDLWLRAERQYWMSRCRAGRRQKERQDALGIGWSNIDHHTYDSSRRHYRHTIRILEKLGYELREMLYAGELAGWGSQVLEQPTLKSTIFADVDLSPEELTIDFAHEELPELPQHKRAGFLSALHGESILEAGLNHVAGLYDRRRLQQQLNSEGFEMMAPFSDFDHLYQELTHGDWAAVDPRRVDELEAGGHIPAEEAEQIRLNGAIVAHLENIERNHGYKGFNREGIDSVLRKLDPRAYEAAEVGAASA